LQRFLTALAIALPAISMAGPADDENAAWKKIFNLLPPGSEMKKVMLPRYDPDKKLSSVLKAEMMTLVSEDQIEGKTIAIEFFNPNQTTKGRIDLTRAMIDKTKGMLTTKEPVEIKIDGLKANGTGLYYGFEKGQGFLLGPATTIIQQPPENAMNIHSSSPARAIALVGMSLFTQSLLAAPPPAITDEQLAAIQADARTRAPAAEAKAAEAVAALETNIKDAEAASEAAATFLVQADLPAVKPEEPTEEAEPLEVPAGPDNTVISCDGGIYFDPDEGVLVYLKNVTVNDPRFDLSGANELKVFFGKKPVDPNKPAKAAGDKSKKGFGADAGAGIGDPERIIATGVIKINQKPADGKEPIQASGAIFTYNVKTDEATLSGGFPWVKQGARYFSSKKSDNLLRIYPNESRFDTPGGGWNMGFPIPKKK